MLAFRSTLIHALVVEGLTTDPSGPTMRSALDEDGNRGGGIVAATRPNGYATTKVQTVHRVRKPAPFVRIPPGMHYEKGKLVYNRRNRKLNALEKMALIAAGNARSQRLYSENETSTRRA